MKSHLILMTAAALSFSSVFAQESNVPKRRIIPEDISIQEGDYRQRIPAVTVEEFKTLAPKSVLLGTNLMGFSSDCGADNRISHVSSITAALGFVILNKQKIPYRANPKIRIGLTYFPTFSLRCDYSQGERQPYDTIISAQTGQQRFIDTITGSDLKMMYHSNHASLDLLFSISTKSYGRFSFSGGIGVLAGMSLKPQTTIIRTNYGYANYDTVGRFPHERLSHGENFHNKKSLAFSAFVPLTANFRLSNKSRILKKLSLFYEARIGVRIVSIPDLYTLTRSMLQHSLGLKFSLNNKI